MDRNIATKRVIAFFLCLLLTSCGAKSNEKWLVFGFDIKTKLGIRPDPVETFAGCIRQQKKMTASELKRLFQHETAAIRNNRDSGDWGQMVCLAFHESATELQVDAVLSLMPKEKLSARENLIINILRPLLEQRVKNQARLKRMEKQLEIDLKTINALKEQVNKLQEIEGILEKD